MFFYLAKKVFGTKNDRVLKALRPIVAAVNGLEAQYKKLSDDELRALTPVFKQRIEKGESLESVMPEAFAVVREASVRTLGLRHFDVQLIGGAVLHRGMIAEMKTGEGKTLVATLAAYLNALTGKGVHIVTVNDYLARRDSEWMGRIYNFLGLSVGVVYPGLNEATKRAAYRADITYGQNNEFGFDYLRDNMKFTADEMMQRGHAYAIVDEVDSILIDEARTPLIISGPAEDATDKYFTVNKIIPRLEKGKDFELDLKSKQPTLSEAGVAHAEQLLNVDNLYDPNNIEILHHVVNALKAHYTLERDVDYVVKDGEVVIVDEFTGRLMSGRRWSDGLHQAVEAKEHLQIARENQTLASITFQNLFRMYKKLAGMTGTADTEAGEFKQIYNLEVVVVPTHMQMIRRDLSDQVFRTRREKAAAVVEDIARIHETGQPILVGTISIEQSESLSKLLKTRGVSHNVLNAKHHEREAEIVAQAGRLGAVTISTNMAGRGTDIMLGGNPEFLAASKVGTKDRSSPAFQQALAEFKETCRKEHEQVVAAGGLFILGTERHESRRIDNQLRGRSGRQGDPGTSRFFVSLEDDLMLRFGGERMQNMMKKFGWEEGLAMDGRLISRSIESAQRKVEAYHFEIRKHVTEYDDVMNKQRQVIYNLRSKILFNEGIRAEILDMATDLIEEAVLSSCEGKNRKSGWNISALKARYEFLFRSPSSLDNETSSTQQEVFDHLCREAKELYEQRARELDRRLLGIAQIEGISLQLGSGEAFNGDSQSFDFAAVERDTFLSAVDHYWNTHLHEMDHLREGIGLRGYGQKNPLHEYQKEGFLTFQRMLENLKEAVVRRLYYYEVPTPEELLAHIEAERTRREAVERSMRMVHNEMPQTPADQPHEILVKDPEAERARMKAQKKMRQKMRR